MNVTYEIDTAFFNTIRCQTLIVAVGLLRCFKSAQLTELVNGEPVAALIRLDGSEVSL